MSSTRKKRFSLVLDEDNYNILRAASLYRAVARNQKSISMSGVINELIATSTLPKEAAALRDTVEGLADG